LYFFTALDILNYRKKDIGIPAMLEASPSTRQAALEAKFGELLTKQESVNPSGMGR